MFSGSMSNKKDDQLVIDLPDVEPDAFRQLIRYLYTDQVHLTADNVTSILYLSKKYMINNLTQECIKFLGQKMTAETAPIVLDQSMFFDEKELKEKALETIKEKAPEVLSSDEFSKMSHQALNEVVQLNLKIEKELQVFQACIKWAEQRCLELKQSVEGVTKREALSESLFLIRFPTMSIDDFNDHVVPQHVLTAVEENQIFRYITSTSNKPQDLPFPTEPRVKKLNAHVSQGATAAKRQTHNAATYTYQQMSCGHVVTRPREWRTMETGVHGKRFIAFARNVTFTSKLKCYLTSSIQIRQILLGAADDSSLQHHVSLTTTQNKQLLANYSGSAHLSGNSVCTVNLNDVKVDAGPMKLKIHIKVKTGCLTGFVFYVSDPNETRMHDNYVSINFTGIKNNPLHGIKYSCVD